MGFRPDHPLAAVVAEDAPGGLRFLFAMAQLTVDCQQQAIPLLRPEAFPFRNTL